MGFLNLPLYRTWDAWFRCRFVCYLCRAANRKYAFYLGDLALPSARHVWGWLVHHKQNAMTLHMTSAGG